MYIKNLSLSCLLLALTASSVLAAPKTRKTEVYPVQVVRSADQKEDIKEIGALMNNSLNAWNEHRLNDLIKAYAQDFKTQDGSDLSKVSQNLKKLWLQYPDVKIVPQAAQLYVYGEYASLTLNEFSTGTGRKGENGIPADGTSNLRVWTSGYTHLKKVNGNWKIVSEEVFEEEMWQYYGTVAEKLLLDGKVKLSLPGNVIAGENYIAELSYDLPENIKGLALIERVNESAEAKVDLNEEKRQKDLSSLRRPIEFSAERGLRRLFAANQENRDELVVGQVELVSLEGKSPRLVGLLGVSRRVVPRPKLQPENPSKETKAQNSSFKEEALK